MKLKNSIVNIIVFIQMLLVMLMGSDCESTFVFIISKIIIVSLFLLNHFILIKYSDLFEGGE